jgi:hypothetical protein
MNMRDLFKKLGAPLRNFRWSWGAVRRSDGVVFLRVWEDDRIWRKDREFVRLLANGKIRRNHPGNLGYRERLTHVKLVRHSHPCYMIMCVAVDPGAIPRKVAYFNNEELFPGGELIDFRGGSWLELLPCVPISHLWKRSGH